MASGLSISFAGAKSVEKAPLTNGNKHNKPNGIKRPHAALGDDSDDEHAPVKQLVTHFGTKGAVNAAAPELEKGPLVIKAQSNRDWREASKAARAEKRAKYGLPPEDATQDAKTQEEQIKRLEDANKPTWGLNVKTNGSRKSENGHDSVEGDGIHDQPNQAPDTLRPKTDDERAMDALLGSKQQSTLTIPATTEEEAFQKDYKHAPRMATLEEYAAVPVEEFGAALLRGMGWKEGYGIGNHKERKLEKQKVVERRPALLGIGAKEDAAVKEEIGAWGRGAQKANQIYNPIVMRNKITGEEVTEQELKEKIQGQEIRQQQEDLDALASRKRDDDRDRAERTSRRRRHDFNEDDSDRGHRDRRRERTRDDFEYEHKDRRRSKDRKEGRRNHDLSRRRERDSKRTDEEEDRQRHRDDRKRHRDCDNDRRRRY